MKTTKSEPITQFPELKGCIETIRFPAFAEIKFDGEFQFLFYNSEEEPSCVLINKYGTTRSDFPALNNIAKRLLENNINKATFLCELCLGYGKAGDFYELQKNKTSDELNIILYDIVQINEQDVRETKLIDRKELLLSVFKNKSNDNDYILVSRPHIVNSKEEVSTLFETSTKEHQVEGLVLKNLDSQLVLGPCSWCKIKKTDKSDFKIVLIDPVKERIEVEVKLPDGKTHNSGCKVSDNIKKTLKVGAMITIEYEGILESGGLRNPRIATV